MPSSVIDHAAWERTLTEAIVSVLLGSAAEAELVATM
jgi:hypothetical protein